MYRFTNTTKNFGIQVSASGIICQAHLHFLQPSVRYRSSRHVEPSLFMMPNAKSIVCSLKIREMRYLCSGHTDSHAAVKIILVSRGNVGFRTLLHQFCDVASFNWKFQLIRVL